MENNALIIASHAFHTSKSICIVCTLNSLCSNYYHLLDAQPELDDLRPEQQAIEYQNDDLSLFVLDSSCGSSMHYLLTNLHKFESSEFEAYISVGRNLVEKLSRLNDILVDPAKKKQASLDFTQTVSDVTWLFKSAQPKATALQMKHAKWLGRGTNRSNITDEKFELLYAYLSRTLHVSNMDTLLHPKEDRFFVKAYILITVAQLYHQTVSNIPYLSSEGRRMHAECAGSLKKSWLEVDSSPEVIIYCTSYFDNMRSKLETSTLKNYILKLNKAFVLYKSKDVHILPRFEVNG